MLYFNTNHFSYSSVISAFVKGGRVLIRLDNSKGYGIILIVKKRGITLCFYVLTMLCAGFNGTDLNRAE